MVATYFTDQVCYCHYELGVNPADLWDEMIGNAGVVSLYELMFRYSIDEFCSCYRALVIICKEQSYQSLLGPEQTPEEIGTMAIVLKSTLEHSKALEMDQTLIEQIERFYEELAGGSANRQVIVLQVKLRAIIDGIQSSLGRSLFYVVEKDKSRHVNNIVDIVGTTHVVFPEAIMDILEMNLCYAFGRNTAVIFHAMRVSEYGLRSVAKALKVSLKDKGKRCPVEYGTWNKVIEAIQSKITAIRKTPTGPAREQQLKFYADCAFQCSYIRDIWRNEISHTRRSYNGPEALSAMTRVREFMELLSAGIPGRSARKRLPTSATKALNSAAKERA